MATVAHDAVRIVVEEQVPCPLALLLDSVVDPVSDPVVRRDNRFEVLRHMTDRAAQQGVWNRASEGRGQSEGQSE